MKVYDHEGQEYQLGKEIGRGGEGVVYHVDSKPDLVAKIYHKPKEKEKLLSMVKSSNSDLLEVAAWPVKVLIEKGLAKGFLCKKIRRGKEIHKVFHPKDRKRDAPKISWAFLIHTALNLSTAFYHVHQTKLIVGDVNDRNLLVLPDATVNFIDCDSFHFSNAYPCSVGMPLYLPPEWENGSVSTKESDHFALAVLIFQLLFMGRHPFAGSYVGRSELSLFEAIKEGCFCFSEKVSLPHHALPFSIISKELQKLFIRAFTTQKRPTAREWIDALAAFESQLSRCSLKHDFFGQTCCWCASEERFSIDYFSNQQKSPFQEKIEAIPSPGPLPKLVIRTDAVTSRPIHCEENLIGLCAIPLISVGFYYCPMLCPLIFIGALFSGEAQRLLEIRRRKKRVQKLEERWESLIQRWQNEASDRRYLEQYRKVLKVQRYEELQSGLEELRKVCAVIKSARENLSEEIAQLAQHLKQAREDLESVAS